jgi:hypothetical protein
MAKKVLNTPLQQDDRGVPSVVPQTGLYGEAVGENQGGVQPTYWEKFWAQAGESFWDSAPSAAMGRLDQQGDLIREGIIQGQDKFTAAEANRRYPGMPEPFTHDVYPSVAEMMWNEHERRQRTKAWIDRGPQTGFGFDLATGSVSSLDPYNIMGGLLVGELTSGLGIARGLKGGLKGVGTVFGENLAVNAAGTSAGILTDKLQGQDTPSLREAVANVTGGAILGTGIHLVIDAAFGRAAREAGVSKPGDIAKNADAAVKQHESGSRIDMTPASVLESVREAGIAARGVEMPYAYVKLEHPGQVYYHTPVDAQTQWTGSSEPLSGIVGVDNPQVAHNLAGGDYLPGKVIRSELADGSKLADANAPLGSLFEGLDNEQAAEKIAGILGAGRREGEYLDVFKKILAQGGSIGDAFRAFEDIPKNKVLPANVTPTAAFRSLLDGLGYDGLSFRGEIGGTPVDNRVLVYNQDALRPVDIVDVNQGSVPTYSVEAQNMISDRAQETQNQRFYDPELVDKTKKLSTQTDEKIKPTAQDYVKQLEQNAIKDLETRAAENPDLQEEMQKIDAEYKQSKMFKESVKVLGECMTSMFS